MYDTHSLILQLSESNEGAHKSLTCPAKPREPGITLSLPGAWESPAAGRARLLPGAPTSSPFLCPTGLLVESKEEGEMGGMDSGPRAAEGGHPVDTLSLIPLSWSQWTLGGLLGASHW